MVKKNRINTELFFSLLRAGLWEHDVRLSNYDDIDSETIMSLSEEQSVVGLVTAGLEHVADKQIPKEVLLQFIGRTIQLEQSNTAMNKYIAGLIMSLRKEGVYALLVKGQGVAQCYERPLWRSCGDIDLFLSDDNYTKTKEFLKPLASSVECEYLREKHLGMTLEGWSVELHGRLYSGLSSRIERELDEVYKDTFYGGSVRSWDNNGVQVFLLKAENDVFYVFTHILQHFYKEGVGLRQICDWCRLLWTYRDKLDLQLLEGRIKRAGLMTAWRAFGAYAVDYLGIPVEAMPFYSPDARWKLKAKRINSFVISVGNMGHNRDSNYYGKCPYVVRKYLSVMRRVGDLMNHARLFPLDALRFSVTIFVNGMKSAARREG